MLFCSIPSAVYNILGNLGVYNLPFIGSVLQDLLSSIIDLIGCH